MIALFHVAVRGELTVLSVAYGAAIVLLVGLGFLLALHLVASVILSTRDRRTYAALALGIAGAVLAELALNDFCSALAHALTTSPPSFLQDVQLRVDVAIATIIVSYTPRFCIGLFVGRVRRRPDAGARREP